MTFDTEQYGSLSVKPIMEGFGAEVSGADFSVSPIPDDVLRTMIEIQDKYAVTVYRSTGLDDARHVAFSKQLGELELVPRFGDSTQLPRFDDPHLFDVGNLTSDGTIVPMNSRRWWFIKGTALWHTDSSFNQHRSKYSLLLAHELPKEGGSTGYADVRRAYNDLSQDKKDKLQGLVAEHSIWYSRKLAAPEEYKSPTEQEMNAKPPAYHKLVQPAPDGRETIFIAKHIKRILGWHDDEGLALINELIDHCTQPQYIFYVKWNAPGDLVWWDNRACMHRATPFSDQMERRDMRRTTVFEEKSEYSHGVQPSSEDIAVVV